MKRTARGDIVLGWLVRVLVILAILGTVAFEAGACVVARVNADGTAEAAAQDAALMYGRNHDATAAREEAQKRADQSGAKLAAFFVSADGEFVTVTIEKLAPTFLIQHIGPLKKFRRGRSTHTIKVT